LVDAADSGSPAGHILEIIDSGASGNAMSGASPLTVGCGAGYDPDQVARDTADSDSAESKESVASGIH
jgi:hypothetical protein